MYILMHLPFCCHLGRCRIEREVSPRKQRLLFYFITKPPFCIFQKYFRTASGLSSFENARQKRGLYQSVFVVSDRISGNEENPENTGFSGVCRSFAIFAWIISWIVLNAQIATFSSTLLVTCHLPTALDTNPYIRLAKYSCFNPHIKSHMYRTPALAI